MPRTDVQEAEIIDSETGEVKSLNKIEEYDPRELVKLLKMGDAAKEEDFEDPDKDFWKPTEPGDELRGAYIGHDTVGRGDNRRRVHAVAVLGGAKKNRPMAVRFNGTAALNAKLQNFKPKTYIRIRYLGTEKTTDGYNAKLFDVVTLREKDA
jgi:hypothetical protein